MAMERVTVDGKTLNRRTARMLAMWQFNCLTDFYVVQGSYNSGVGASAGTHDGGGALDLSVYGWDDKFIEYVVREGRRTGFAAWWRKYLPRVWNAHIHAIALNDPEASSGAKAQMVDYRNRKDGLAGHGADPGPITRIWEWPVVPRNKQVNLLVVYRQFRAKKPVARTSVKRVQWVLNEKLGTRLVCDGVAGPKTRDAYKAWEKKINAPVADGLPGRPSLNRLGDGRFKVSFLSYEKMRKSHHNKITQIVNEAENPTFKNHS